MSFRNWDIWHFYRLLFCHHQSLPKSFFPVDNKYFALCYFQNSNTMAWNSTTWNQTHRIPGKHCKMDFTPYGTVILCQMPLKSSVCMQIFCLVTHGEINDQEKCGAYHSQPHHKGVAGWKLGIYFKQLPNRTKHGAHFQYTGIFGKQPTAPSCKV